MARTPKRLSDQLGACGRQRLGESVDEPYDRRFEEVGACATLNQPTSSVPLPERGRVRHGGSACNHGTGRFDVGTCVKERIEHGNVVTARRPMQRRLGVRSAEPPVDLSTCGRKDTHNPWIVSFALLALVMTLMALVLLPLATRKGSRIKRRKAATTPPLRD